MAGKKLAIEMIAKTRKRNPPRTAFKPGNKHRFAPGAGSPNPGGKSKEELKLVSKSLRIQLNCRAPDAVSKAVGAAKGASWAQCVACALLRGAVSGDTQAARLIIETVEGKAPTALSIGGLDGEPLFPGTASGPKINVIFTDSDGDGRLPADYDGEVIEG